MKYAGVQKFARGANIVRGALSLRAARCVLIKNRVRRRRLRQKVISLVTRSEELSTFLLRLLLFCVVEVDSILLLREKSTAHSHIAIPEELLEQQSHNKYSGTRQGKGGD
jgi:hypothetical protein